MDQVQQLPRPDDQDTIQKYGHFLEDEYKKDTDGAAKRIIEMMKDTRSASRLIVNLDKLRDYDSNHGEDLTTSLLTRPFENIPLFERALLTVVKEEDPNYLEELANDENAMRQYKVNEQDNPLHIGLEGSFGQHLVSPRGLSSNFVTQMVAVEGIATKCSAVRPKVVRSIHYCPQTRAHSSQNYQDATSLTGPPTTSVYPSKDPQGNPLETEFGLSVYKDHQTFTIQEMPERAPLGQMPRSVDIVADNDLVDVVKPGDRVRVVGIFRALAGNAAGSTSGVFRTVLLANNIEQMSKQATAAPLTGQDIENFQDIAERRDVFDLISRSLAPSIYGHKYIKQALALLLAGGTEKNLSNGTHIRGDINMLMVGDPSTAKSQLLRFTQAISPLAINATGRGSSGVGLTAAVTTDPETGDRRLEAGAMVLADRGIVCIDEFDKMSDIDRVSIHEAMEQQTVTIAKAGIQAQLNARCSVVAAANPIYGAYDTTMAPQANVNLPDSLLSRFDLLFIVIDDLNEERDRAIAGHVLGTHRYVNGEQGNPQSENPKDDEEETNDEMDGSTPVFQKFNALLHGGAAAETTSSSKQKAKRGRSSSARGQGADAAEKVEILHPEFIKKYLQYAKRRQPKFSGDSARKKIVTAYNEMRQKADTVHVSTPVTARALETLIRLSTAHAKLRLSERVEPKDVKRAVEILSVALFDAQPDDVKRRKRKADREEPEAGSDDSDSDDDDNDDHEDASAAAASQKSPKKKTPARKTSPKKQKTATGRGKETPTRKASPRAADEDSSSAAAGSSSSSSPAARRTFPQSIVREFTRGLAGLFRRENDDALTEGFVQEELCDKDSSPTNLKSLGRQDVIQILEQLHNEGKIMYSDGFVHYI